MLWNLMFRELQILRSYQSFEWSIYFVVIRVSREIVQEYFDQYPELPCVIRVINGEDFGCFFTKSNCKGFEFDTI